MKVTTKQLKKQWIEFNIKKGHTKIEDASVVPTGDEVGIFTVAGMHPLVPYLTGKKHPAGSRLTNSQRCIRTADIEEVGDDTHCTFFEMLGTWSLGDYFKEKAIKDIFEFLTSKNYVGLDKSKIAVTVFEGDENAPRDTESYKVYKELGLSEENIFFLPKKENWWSAGDTGPCGPDSEIFLITDKKACGENCSPACDCGKYIEIGNNVFMQYLVEKAGEKPKPLSQKNVDRGMGLERMVLTLNGYKSIYELDVFKEAIKILEKNTEISYEENKKAYRVIVEHMRTATFILGDKTPTVPNNLGRGYVLRRIIRRTVRFARTLNLDISVLNNLVEHYINYHKEDFKELEDNKQFILNELKKEVEKFDKTIASGTKEFEKVVKYIKGNGFPGKTAFRLYDTFGFPLELTIEMATERGFKVDEDGFNKAFEEHKNKSKGNLQKGEYKGGLSKEGDAYAITKYHTATHLLLAALKQVYGDQVIQRGSNTTEERLRFDFNLDRKMTDEEKKQVTKIVNDNIKEAIEVKKLELKKEEAYKIGASGIFDDKYGDIVSVYTIGDFSKEFCGGPHVKNTSELGEFVIKKESSSSAGVRRIKAILK